MKQIDKYIESRKALRNVFIELHELTYDYNTVQDNEIEEIAVNIKNRFYLDDDFKEALEKLIYSSVLKKKFEIEEILKDNRY